VIGEPEVSFKPNNIHPSSDFLADGILLRRQRSLQYLTDSQSRAHFLRQLKLRPQVSHCLLERFLGMTVLIHFRCGWQRC